jgi:hypothetical protein
VGAYKNTRRALSDRRENRRGCGRGEEEEGERIGGREGRRERESEG